VNGQGKLNRQVIFESVLMLCAKNDVLVRTKLTKIDVFLAPSGLRGCKNGPAPFPGRMSYKATKPGLVWLSYLSMLYYYIVVY